jgi:hypothetical protein
VRLDVAEARAGDDHGYAHPDSSGRLALRVRAGRYRMEYRAQSGDRVPGREIIVLEGDEQPIDVTFDR